MGIRVEAGGEIQARPDEVFSFLADASNNPSWQKGMASCEWTSPPPIGLGSTYEQRAHFLGREIRSSFEVVEFVPGRRIRITTTAGTFPITVTRSVEPLGEERCRVAAIVEGDANGVFRIAAPAMTAMVRRSVRADYARLTQLLETGSTD